MEHKYYSKGNWRYSDKKSEVKYYLPTLYPTPEQKEMNNGMTDLKLRILKLRCRTNDLQRSDGHISTTQCFTANLIYFRDMEILKGKEPAYLQG